MYKNQMWNIYVSMKFVRTFDTLYTTYTLCIRKSEFLINFPIYLSHENIANKKKFSSAKNSFNKYLQEKKMIQNVSKKMYQKFNQKSLIS